MCGTIDAAQVGVQHALFHNRPHSLTAVSALQVRCSRLLYTLCVEDSDKADKLKQSLPPGETWLCPLTFLLAPHLCIGSSAAGSRV